MVPAQEKNPKSDFMLHCSRAYIYCRKCLYPHLQQNLSVLGLVIWSTSSAKNIINVTDESLKCFVLKVLMLPPLCICFDVVINALMHSDPTIPLWENKGLILQAPRTQGYTKVLTKRKPWKRSFFLCGGLKSSFWPSWRWSPFLCRRWAWSDWM